MVAMKVVYTVLEVLIAISCCLGNMSVIWVVGSNRNLRQPTFLFVVSLAVADFLVGCVAVPVAVVVDGRVKIHFYSCLFLSCVVILITVVSVLILMAIALDRFLRVAIPLRYKRTVTQRHSQLVVAVCWFAAVILSFTPMFGFYNQKTMKDSLSSNSSTILCQFIAVIPMSYLVYFNFFICNLLPLFVMAVMYGYIFFTIRKTLRGRPGSSSQAQFHAYLKKEKKLAVSLSLLLAFFVFCMFPLHIMNCIAYFRIMHVSDRAFYVGILLSHANSAVNPFIYAFKIQKIKQAYLRIWKKCITCGVDQEMSASSQTSDKVSNNPNSEDKTE